MTDTKDTKVEPEMVFKVCASCKCRRRDYTDGKLTCDRCANYISPKTRWRVSMPPNIWDILTEETKLILSPFLIGKRKRQALQQPPIDDA